MFNKLKKQTGITLIALIIAIIVLLILAGISISLVIGDNGILTQSSSSVIKNREAKAKEEVQLAWSSAETKYYTDWAKNTSVNKDDYYGDEVLLSIYVADTGTVESSVKNSDGQTWTVKYRAKDQNQLYTFIIDEIGNIQIKKGGISLSKTAIKLKQGKTETLEATLDGITGNVTWESSAPEIVSVTSGGTITALGNTGTAIIKAKIAGTIYEDTCTVTIIQKITEISANSLKVEEGKTKQIVVETTPSGENVEDLIYTYTSDNIEIATVDENTGLVTGVSEGNTTISIRGTKEGSSEILTTSCMVEVIGPLKIGDTVLYEPTGTYEWKAEYATSYATDLEDYTNSNIMLQTIKTGESLGITNEITNQDMSITSWKVLRINENTETVELVPSEATINKVRLHGAQGYNNGVKLLNDACSALYGGEITKEGTEYTITARSINIEDFEGKNGTTEGRTLTDEAITERNNYTNNCSTSQWTDESVKYNATFKNKFTVPSSGMWYRNDNAEFAIQKYYPVIYSREKNNIINATVTLREGVESNLGLSSQTQFIERNEGLSDSSKQGAKLPSVGIKPRQTYYKLGDYYSTFSGKFKQYEIGKTYANLLLPSGKDTRYWIASRCINLKSCNCSFNINSILSGHLVGHDVMWSRLPVFYGPSESLFPVVTLSSELITVGDSGFEVLND